MSFPTVVGTTVRLAQGDFNLPFTATRRAFVVEGSGLCRRFGTANVKATGTGEYRTVPASNRYRQRTERSSGSFAW